VSSSPTQWIHWVSKANTTALSSCGSVVELILFMILLSKNQFYVIKSAILGSMLANMLFCMGLCFFFGGMLRHEQTFSDAVSEVGSGLLLTA
jgi:Ca2+:H+ antiporter